MIPYRSVHFIGILTPEMASLAAFTARNNCKVTGSDEIQESIYHAPLMRYGVTFFTPFAAANISRSTDLVVVSPYYDSRHVEVVAAQDRKITVLSATQYTKEISEQYRRFVVLDEYEAPLIATYLAHVFQQGHFNLNALTHTVPSDPNDPNDPGLALTHESEWFLMPLSGFKRDATTYEASFLSFIAEIVILPCVRYDYPELNMTLDDVYQTYYRFVKSVPRKGLIIGNSDYARMKRLRGSLADRHIETYGLDTDASWRIREVETKDRHTSFYLTHSGKRYGPFEIPYTGEIALYSATAVCVAGLMLEMRPDVIQRGLATLPPLRRYSEEKHDKEGRIIIDDRADHPDTIRAVLENIRTQYPQKKIWCLYEPGSFLRTKALFEELKAALSLADTVYIADIHGYPKEKSEGLHIRQFIADMKKSHSQTYYFDSSLTMTGLLSDRVALNDCIVTLGGEGICQQAVKPLLPDTV